MDNVNPLLWVFGVVVAFLFVRAVTRNLQARQASSAVRDYVSRRVLGDAAFKSLLSGLRCLDHDPGFIGRWFDDTSERDRKRVELLQHALGQARLSRQQADRVLKLIADNEQNVQARALLRYPALLREELLERELEE